MWSAIWLYIHICKKLWWWESTKCTANFPCTRVHVQFVHPPRNRLYMHDKHMQCLCLLHWCYRLRLFTHTNWPPNNSIDKKPMFIYIYSLMRVLVPPGLSRGMMETYRVFELDKIFTVSFDVHIDSCFHFDAHRLYVSLCFRCACFESLFLVCLCVSEWMARRMCMMDMFVHVWVYIPKHCMHATFSLRLPLSVAVHAYSSKTTIVSWHQHIHAMSYDTHIHAILSMPRYLGCIASLWHVS